MTPGEGPLARRPEGRRAFVQRNTFVKLFLSILVMLGLLEEVRFFGQRMARAVSAWFTRLDRRDARHILEAEVGYLIRHSR
jgi:hypothetical protein